MAIDSMGHSGSLMDTVSVLYSGLLVNYGSVC
jgi:hypothetical protein